MEKTRKRSQINNVTLQHKELEKEEQTKSKAIRRKKIKITAEINEIKNRKIIEKINETNSWFFEKNKINKPFPRWPKKKRRLKLLKLEI